MAHNFQLNEEDTLIQNRKKATPGGIIGWLMRKNIVSTPGQANAILVLFIIVGLGIIVYVNLRTFGG
jgi:hypothetical protein